ncbi:MAG TPA: YceI family protein [Gaiellales bacterium]|jgi:polyisoprenoid-binding protein YceI
MSTLESTATGSLPAGTWQLDAVHSQVGFAVKYMVGTFRGSFSPVAATLAVAQDGSAGLTGSARAENVKVQEPSLIAHLLSPDFFDAERAPELQFRSTGIRTSGDHVAVDGDLTIKGSTRPVTLEGSVTEPITDPYGRERIGITLNGTIDRTDFGITWNNPLPSGKSALANEVSLDAELYLVKE